MPVYIAFLRGINVGGTGKLPMKELTGLLEGIGATAVRTYIQSGNAVFTSREKTTAAVGARITAAIKKAKKIEPHVLVLTPAELAAAAAANPFGDAVGEPNRLFLGFLAATPANPNIEKLDQFKAPTERYQLKGRVFYFHAPGGAGNSKLASAAEKAIGVPMTMRNWRTVETVLAMAGAPG